MFAFRLIRNTRFQRICYRSIWVW